MRLACLVPDSFARGIAESGRGGRQSTPISALHDSDTLFPEKAVDQAVHKYELIYALERLPASQQSPCDQPRRGESYSCGHPALSDPLWVILVEAVNLR